MVLQTRPWYTPIPLFLEMFCWCKVGQVLHQHIAAANALIGDAVFEQGLRVVEIAAVDDQFGRIAQHMRRGLGDMVVGKHVGKLMGALGGRMDALRKALAGEEPMEAALERNVTLNEDAAGLAAGLGECTAPARRSRPARSRAAERIQRSARVVRRSAETSIGT